MYKKHTLAWFLFGLGSQLQIVASMSFTELFVFIAAPCWFLSERQYLKQNGVMTFFILSVAVFCACIISCVVNETPRLFALRGLAVTILLPCTIVVGHRMLRINMNGIKWMLVGVAISNILSIFVFQKSVEVYMYGGGEFGEGAVSGIISNPLFWISRMGSFLMLIPQGWYLQCPLFISVVVPIFLSFFSLFTSSSGRSAALVSVFSAVIILACGKAQRKMFLMGKHILFLCIILGLCLLCFKFVYSKVASEGLLNEAATEKYLRQTKEGSGIFQLIMSGRMESFCGLIACIDRPIIGFGPWAEDKWGYIGEYLNRFGSQEDYDNYENVLRYEAKNGIVGLRLIPGHSHITMFWLWYGICGLIFWLYVIFVLIRYIKEDAWAVPQWFMWLAAAVPGYLWHIAFSPFGNRVGTIMFILACLMVRAVRKGTQQLPYEMILEIERNRR